MSIQDKQRQITQLQKQINFIRKTSLDRIQQIERQIFKLEQEIKRAHQTER